MSKRRIYGQFCGIAKALDVVGERWTLLIVRELLLGPRRYNDLLNNLKGITTNLLALRLKELEAAGVLERQFLPPPAKVAAYGLTSAGRELEPALLALGRWGWRFMDPPHKGDRAYFGWALIALKRRFRGVAMPLTLEFSADGQPFQLRLMPDYPDVREGAPWIADVSAVGAFKTFRELFYSGTSATKLETRGDLVVTGDRNAWNRFLSAFELTR